jgi:putative membrane protein
MKTSTVKTLLVALLGGGLLIGCAKAEDADDGAVQDTATQTTTPAPAPAGPSDAEIAHIVVTANTIDIDAGKLAKEKSKNAEVKAFADKMIAEHTGSNQQASDLAGRLNVTPADNATSQALSSGATTTMETLRGKSGADFDRAYVDNEVAFHQQVLDAIDQTLIPSAQNADLKSLLQQTRPVIAGHLDMAKRIQSSLPAAR